MGPINDPMHWTTRARKGRAGCDGIMDKTSELSFFDSASIMEPITNLLLPHGYTEHEWNWEWDYKTQTGCGGVQGGKAGSMIYASYDWRLTPRQLEETNQAPKLNHGPNPWPYQQ